jgi:nitrous oxidase accessory protein NosD
MKKRMFLSLLSAALLVLAASVALGQADPIRYVPTRYLTIQAAINAANPGDTIFVAKGTYDEQVVINKSLTLRGCGDRTIIKPSGIEKLVAFTNPNNFTNYSAGYNGKILYSIIVVSDVGVAGVTIKNLKVDGANITSLPGGVENPTDWIEGIKYSQTAGTIKNVTVANLRTTLGTVRTHGIDVSAGGGPVSVEIDGCRISNWQRNAIMTYGGANYLTVNIHDNTLTGPGSIGPDNVPNGVVLVTDVGGMISDNTISGCHYSLSLSYRSVGIMMFDLCPAGVVIENNDVYDVDDGVNVSNDAIVRNNYLHGNGAGVVLEYSSASNQQIVSNTITNNINGIQINGALNPNTLGQDPPGDGNVAHYNNIVGNEKGFVSYDNTKTFGFDAENNWWGANNGPGYVGPGSGDAVSDYVDYDPWLVIGVSANPPSIPIGKTTSTITADMTKNSASQDSGGYVPNGTKVIFTTDKGSIGSKQVTKTTYKGIAKATLTSDMTPGIAHVTASAPPHTEPATACTTVVFTPATIMVNVPNGNETWTVRNTYNITWTSANVTGKVNIAISRDGGRTWRTIFYFTPNDGSQPWKVTGPATTRARIKVSSVINPAIFDISDADFTIFK